MQRFIFLFLTILSVLSINAQEKGWQLRLDFITPSIVRVRLAQGDTVPCDPKPSDTGICNYESRQKKVKWKKKKIDEFLTRYTTQNLTVDVNEAEGGIYFRDKKNNDILYQNIRKGTTCEQAIQERITYDEKSAHVEETANGKVTVKDILRRDTIGRSNRYDMVFSDESEYRYGLGCQMEDYMNLVGKTIYLTQHNLKAMVPVLISDGYGILFDAGCAMKYTSVDKYACDYTIQLDAAKYIDYYFIKGETIDEIIAGYRFLTGDVSMMPRYVFGYTQSKERYCSSDEIVNTLKEYRRLHVPIDMIVQDWNYWPQGWGYMKMNPKYYPSPKALADSVHALNAKLMVSIWPNPQWCPEADDFKSRGMMLEHDIYDAFNPEARKLYWKYANDEFYSNGFDAWWCDSSEPLDGDWNHIPTTTPDGKPYGWDSQEYRWKLNKDILSESLGIERSSLFSLYHSMGIYENQRLQTTNTNHPAPNTRVVNLTRSSYAGQQRYGTIVWNGDTHASWKSFRDQIPAGLNYMATGNPYWTVDVGSFFTKDDGRRWFYKGEFPNGVKDDAYKEYYVRMFQWATFLPMLRSHGSDTPREIWQFMTDEEKTSNSNLSACKYAGAILKMINLRYEHIPYIYSMAWKQTSANYTMARLLAFDFPLDEKVYDMKDEYMFGDYLVCPVTHPLSEFQSREVYLPQTYTRDEFYDLHPTSQKWYDYWTGQEYEGGKWIECKSEIDRMPLFVRAGSIIPTTEVAEYTDAQVGKPITINVYPYGVYAPHGAGEPNKTIEFNLYEDEGNNYNYEKGDYSIIPLTWDEDGRKLIIGRREGSFKGMTGQHDFVIKVLGKIKKVHYTGEETTISFFGDLPY